MKRRSALLALITAPLAALSPWKKASPQDAADILSELPQVNPEVWEAVDQIVDEFDKRPAFPTRIIKVISDIRLVELDECGAQLEVQYDEFEVIDLDAYRKSQGPLQAPSSSAKHRPPQGPLPFVPINRIVNP